MGVTTAWEEGLRTRLLTLCLAASPGRRVLGRGRGSPLGVSGILRYLRLTEGLSLGPLLAWRSSDVFYTGLSTRLLHTAQMDRGIYDFARSSGVLYQRAVERPGSSLAFGVTEGEEARYASCLRVVRNSALSCVRARRSSRRSVDSVGLGELAASMAVMRRTSQTLRSVSGSRRSSSRRGGRR